MPQPKASGPRELHLLLSVSALAVIGILLFAMRESTARRGSVADMAVEHAGPLTLWVTQSAGGTRGILEVRHDGQETAAITVPSAWEQREVRGGTLDEVRSDTPSTGYTRWMLPPGLTLSFWTPDSPVPTVHNPSGAALLMHAKRVHLSTGSIDERSVLIKDGTVSLW